MRSQSPPTKKIKLEEPSDVDLLDASNHPDTPADDAELEEADVDEEHCSICLQSLSDRTVLPACSHEFCFDCILIWTEQSRKCPLCARPIGDYLIHNIRSKYDFQKHYLAPLRASPQPDTGLPLSRAQATQRRRARRAVEWGTNARRERERERRAADELERTIEKRRWVYRHDLYAKHVASNPHTRYRPLPTPQQFAANPDLVSRATIFIRRELRVWDSLDVEFLTTFTISIMKQLDIRSEPAIKLIAEFLDMDNEGRRPNAEHFAHELYSYLRSPFRDLSVYDSVVQYDAPKDLSPPRRWERSRRFASESRSPSPGPSRGRETRRARSKSRSASRGPRDARGQHEPKHEPLRRASSPEPPRPPSPASPRANTRAGGASSVEQEWNAGARDTKGKGRAIDVARGMEAGTHTHRQRSRGVRAAGGGPSSAGGQSAPAENKGTGPSAGAGGVCPGGLDTRDGTHASQDADGDRRLRADIGKDARPRVDRERWRGLNTYLAGPHAAAGASKRPTAAPRSASDSATDELPAQLSIRGAARRGTDGAPADPPSTSTTPPEIPTALDRTATGTPALTAVTPTVSTAPPPESNAPMREVLARTRERLAQLKTEAAQRADAGAADPRTDAAPPCPRSRDGTPDGVRGAPRDACTPPAVPSAQPSSQQPPPQPASHPPSQPQFQQPTSQQPSSQQPSSEPYALLPIAPGESPRAPSAAGVRADADGRHGDAHAAGAAALGAPGAAAAARRAAELREATLRVRVRGTGHARHASEARDGARHDAGHEAGHEGRHEAGHEGGGKGGHDGGGGGGPGRAGSSGAGGAEGGLRAADEALRTREEALRARLKRAR